MRKHSGCFVALNLCFTGPALWIHMCDMVYRFVVGSEIVSHEKVHPDGSTPVR